MILYGNSTTSAAAKASGWKSLMFRLSSLSALDPLSVNPVLPLKYSQPTLGHILLIQFLPIPVQTILLPLTLPPTAHPLSLPIPLQLLQIQFHNLHFTPLSSLPPSQAHCPTWLQTSINQQRKEATWALLQMQQRGSLGLLMPVAKASLRSNSQLWHKGTLESWLPKSPSRDLDIPFWSRAGILWPSSAQPPWTRHWRLKMPRAPVPDSHHLYRAQGNSYSGREAGLLSHWHRGHLVCYACLLRKNQGLSGLCYEGWQFNIYATITKPLTCTL